MLWSDVGLASPQNMVMTNPAFPHPGLHDVAFFFSFLD